MSPDRLHQSIAREIAGAALGAALYLPACMLLLASLPVHAQQLSTRRYDVSEGLAHSHVGAIHQDRKGYLWFGTWEGLSRFDGYRFTNYGERDGLRHAIVNDIAEDRQGRLWVGTNGAGVDRLIDDPREDSSSQQSASFSGVRPKFMNFRVGDSSHSNRVNALLFDPADNLWLVTDDGLYLSSAVSNRDPQFKLVVPHRPTATNMAAFADSRGRLWFGMQDELIQVVGDQIIKYGPKDGVGGHAVVSVVEDHQGRLLVANVHEVFEFIAPPSGQSRGRWRRFPITLARDQRVAELVVDAAGTLWVGTWNGLIKYRDGKQTLYTDAQGLSSNYILALAEDRDGNLWVGTLASGVCKLSGEMIISFTRTEGLPNRSAGGVIEDRRGRIYVGALDGSVVEIVEGRAAPVPGLKARPFRHSIPFQDSRGDWWINIAEGLFRFAGPELQLRRGGKLISIDGIPMGKSGNWRFAEDPFGKLWLGCDVGLYRLDLAQKGRAVFERIPLNAGLPAVGSLLSDRGGAIWLGGHEALARLMKGETDVLQPAEGLPEVNPRAFFQDSRGWLWIGLRYKGVSVTKDPGAENLKFVNYSTQTGLASDAVWSITEDDEGRIYLGTGKGLDQLDPMTGRIRHFNTKDGLAGDFITQCLKDRNGNIWVMTRGGLSKFNPRAERKVDHPPPIYLSRAQVAGEDLPLAETGALHISGLELPSSRNNLFIEYVALSFRGEQRLRYQYKLEGVDGDWSQPTEARSVNYARLAPGSYRFMARAINEEGVISPEPAQFRFRILPPLWQRWWFLALAAMLTGAVLYALYRYRVTQLIKLERVRTRIAIDLHDDIGAGLSRVAILSEVVKRQVSASTNSGEQSIPLLAEIADSARGLVESMREIIWAIDPQRDDLSSVISRVRQFASDVLEAKGINWDFKVATELEKIKLDPERRRHLFLIFKEALNNIARHADCRSVSLSLTIVHNQLCGEIRDDGRGFKANGDHLASSTSGRGLENMRQRAAQVGGHIEIDPSPGEGVSIKLMIPLKRR